MCQTLEIIEHSRTFLSLQNDPTGALEVIILSHIAKGDAWFHGHY